MQTSREHYRAFIAKGFTSLTLPLINLISKKQPAGLEILFSTPVIQGGREVNLKRYLFLNRDENDQNQR